MEYLCKCTDVYVFVCLCVLANRGGDSHHRAVDSEGSGVSALHEKNPQRHQGRKHPAEHGGPGQTG